MAALQRGTDQNIPFQNGYYDSPPPLPMRKSRSQGTSLADEDRTSRGADSLISETRTHLTEDIDIKPEIKEFFLDNSDYAVVEKTVIEAKPKNIEKPTRPPAPSRKNKTAAQLTALKNQSINFFFTYPRRAIKKSLHRQSPAPIRPVRNYSSIGPARPPRRNRVFREPVYEGEFIPLRDENETACQNEHKADYTDSEKIESIQLETEVDEMFIEKSDQEEVQETRDLQSGDVIEKMKGRPLPPPPRPPRKTKDDLADAAEEDDEDIEVTDLDEEEEIVVERIDILVGHAEDQDKIKKVKPASVSSDVFQQVEEVCERQQEPQLEVLPSELVEEPPVKAERRKKSLSITRVAPTPVSPIEASVSTQTDTLPEGFFVEEEQQPTGNYSKSEETSNKTSKPDMEKKTEVEKKVETIIEHKVIVIPTPETEILKAKKIHVSELDVERLNVAEIQAQKIIVSDIDGVSMQVTELTSKSGHLVVSGFELPSSFLEAIKAPPAPAIQIQSSTQTPPVTTDSQTNTLSQEVLPSPPQESITQQPPTQPPIPTPPTPQKRPSPPPAIVIQTPQGQSSPAYVPGYIPSSPPPRSPPRTRGAHGHDSDEELRLLPRRRRRHSQRHSTQYSSDEEDEEEYPSYPIARRAHQREPTSSELVRQLVNIWQASFMRGVNQVVEGLNTAFPEGEKRKDAQTAACIILVLIAGLIMLGLGSDKTVHHHHWDFLPPHP